MLRYEHQNEEIMTDRPTDGPPTNRRRRGFIGRSYTINKYMDLHTLEVVLTKVEQVSLADSVNKNKWEEEEDRYVVNNNKVNFSVSLHYLERSEGRKDGGRKVNCRD